MITAEAGNADEVAQNVIAGLGAALEEAPVTTMRFGPAPDEPDAQGWLRSCSDPLQRSALRFAVALLSSLLLAFLCVPPAAAEDRAWAALRDGGVVALIRHARAPGTGDPAGFRLEDCSTQRNLSDAGRAQARQLGKAIADSGASVERVLSSRWCRALETARLAFGSRVEPFQPLDSFFGDRAGEAEQTAAVRNEVATWRGPGVLALVTHQVNITALTEIVPAEGDIVVLRPAPHGFVVLGTLRP